MIFNADAVVDPGAVMVEAFDAAVADGAVARPGSADDLAIRTHIRGVDLEGEQRQYLLEQVEIGEASRVGLYYAWVANCCEQHRDYYYYAQQNCHQWVDVEVVS